MRRLTTKTALITALAACGLALAGGAAAADGSGTKQLEAVVDPSAACATGKLTQPFLPFGDTAWYQLVAGGDFEPRSTPWALRGDAGLQSGNEPWYASSRGDRSSLRLRGGSSAVSPVTCVSIDTPTFRLFARNGGPASSTLVVEAGVRSGDSIRWTRVATLAGGSAWAASPVLWLGAAVFAQGMTSTVSVHLRLSPTGSNASWQVDDVYVDPFKR